MNNWYEFYKKRINSPYQSYFEERYAPFLKILLSYKKIKEEGIGIGSVSKALVKKGIFCYGTDEDRKVLNLCSLNNPDVTTYQENILSQNKMYQKGTDCIVTHGVLEHFSDEMIKIILNYYKSNLRKTVKASVHYVPLDKYSQPSFGDERLLPKEYWIDTFKPTAFFTFNDHHDLCLIFGY
jgi:2-polyprenyl-3-methyl-5-hydroxy-6-metoxy-1,4-benzoquinol methylase